MFLQSKNFFQTEHLFRNNSKFGREQTNLFIFELQFSFGIEYSNRLRLIRNMFQCNLKAKKEDSRRFLLATARKDELIGRR